MEVVPGAYLTQTLTLGINSQNFQGLLNIILMDGSHCGESAWTIDGPLNPWRISFWRLLDTCSTRSKELMVLNTARSHSVQHITSVINDWSHWVTQNIQIKELLTELLVPNSHSEMLFNVGFHNQIVDHFNKRYHLMAYFNLPGNAGAEIHATKCQRVNSTSF